MGKYDLPKYDDWRKWIQRKREKGIAWPQIFLACKNDVQGLASFLKTRAEEDDFPALTIEEWYELVQEIKEYESKQQSIKFRGNDGALFDTNQDNGLRVPQNEHSCWQLYKNSLKWKPESITDLENATIGILRRLSLDTHTTGPIKGLVVGHVQSGKTANMEALMAMAADHGWNMFIVLSGTIENLRLQTLKRMQKDLNKEGNLFWRGVEHPSKNSQFGERAQDFHFEPTSSSRYFTVCLKNASRLKKLIDWIHADRTSHELMKILVIDDEADQASISNNAVEHSQELKKRKGINKLIVDLVSDVHYKAEKSNGNVAAMNYVMYTATPYANFLNECPEDSLYPRHFIWTLKTSDEYIGPNQIFGVAEPDNSDGLDIKRIITDKHLTDIEKLYARQSTDLPQSLKESICWFMCSVSVMRYWNYHGKPISMLVHTSQRQEYHDAVATAISNWVNNNRTGEIFALCEELYEKEIKRIPKKAWLNQFPTYGVPAEYIRDYPAFSEIADGIKLLLNADMQHIKMTDEGDFQYHSGLHLVIDNCSKNGLHNDNDYVRLAYPDPDSEPYPEPAPAFIIVGGSTLSRGLTIEGLVSTFFLRASCQADTLMQMGRWFGYRKGYELLPRIWMTSDTIEKFRFLSQLEVELRADLRKYMDTEVTPIDYGPKLLASPKVSWLRLTSRNHMRNAVPADMDFSGAKPQTVIFDKDADIQRANITITEEFLEQLPGEPSISYDGSALCWKNISLSLIMEKLLVNKFSFSKHSRVFNEIETFCEWIKQVVTEEHLNRWSVIVAGKDEVYKDAYCNESHWNVAGWNVGKVNRSKRKNAPETAVDIGALRALRDCVADIEPSIVQEFISTQSVISKQEHVDTIRKKAGMEKVPMLIIYRIDRNSKARTTENTEREDLDMPCDIIGLHICVPGDQVNSAFCKRLTIYLPEKDKEDEVEEVS